jgi:REP element-mobilizing transposase RayT
MTYNPAKHHRRSIRLKGYDYTQAGAYFVTIVARGRECLFGEIAAGEMQLNEWGRIVEHEWRQTATVRPNVTLDQFVVMPNHIHGIIILNDPDIVGATRRVAPTTPRVTPIPSVVPTPIGPQSGSIGAIIGQFKSIVTKRINATRQTPGAPVWQRNYYEHILRDEAALNRIRQYIGDNPRQWAEDENNPSRQ